MSRASYRADGHDCRMSSTSVMAWSVVDRHLHMPKDAARPAVQARTSNAAAAIRAPDMRSQGARHVPAWHAPFRPEFAHIGLEETVRGRIRLTNGCFRDQIVETDAGT